jgi:hypothetical protein
VIEFVEKVVTHLTPRPAPLLIKNAVLAVFRHETTAAHDAGRRFNPETYRGIVLSIVGSAAD